MLPPRAMASQYRLQNASYQTVASTRAISCVGKPGINAIMKFWPPSLWLRSAVVDGVSEVDEEANLRAYTPP